MTKLMMKNGRKTGRVIKMPLKKRMIIISLLIVFALWIAATPLIYQHTLALAPNLKDAITAFAIKPLTIPI